MGHLGGSDRCVCWTTSIVFTAAAAAAAAVLMCLFI